MSKAPDIELKPMSSFNPAEPAILFDSGAGVTMTWTGEDADDFRRTAVSAPDGAVTWRRMRLEGWAEVLGG